MKNCVSSKKHYKTVVWTKYAIVQISLSGGLKKYWDVMTKKLSLIVFNRHSSLVPHFSVAST